MAETELSEISSPHQKKAKELFGTVVSAMEVPQEEEGAETTIRIVYKLW
jgi:hypothetical protein